MKALILSDLHLDFAKFQAEYEGRRIDEGADVIVLAGDIHEGTGGIRWARATFAAKEIVYVAGNHEFYEHNMTVLSEELREVAKSMGVHFLERDAVEIQGVRFLGTTMWSDYEIYGPYMRKKMMREANMYVNDFKCITTSEGCARTQDGKLQKRLLAPADAIREHRNSVAWLENALTKGDADRTIVVTHHAPHMASVSPQYQTSTTNGAYVSDLTRLLGKSKYWIHGHMHSSSRYEVNGTEVVANPRGYQLRDGSTENPFFEPDLVIEA